MDGQVTRCAQCGAPASSGRFCTNCGAPLESATAPPPPAADLGDTASRKPVYVPPDESAYPEPVPERPLFAEPPHPQPPAEPVERPLFSDTSYARPVYAEPEPPHRGSPGAGLWIGAAAGLVLVLVLGAFLLLRGGGSGDDSPSTTPTPLVPKPQHTKSPPPTTATTTPPTTAPTSAPTGLINASLLAKASAPSHAPAGVDFAGQPVTFVAPNMVDGDSETCWRTPGDATGTVLTFQLPEPITISQVGLINGYAKTAFSGGRRYDWYQGDRRVLSVDWVFDDGSTVSQTFAESRGMQGISVPPVKTSTVQVRITSVSAPGTGPASRNDTAVSEVSLVAARS